MVKQNFFSRMGDKDNEPELLNLVITYPLHFELFQKNKS